MTKLREFATEIIAIGATVLVGVIAWLLPTITLEVEYLVWALGALISISVIALKRELLSRFDERIEIYQMVEGIEDDEFRKMGHDLITECKHRLEKLARETFFGGASEVFSQAIMRMERAQTKVQATHLAITSARLHAWKDLPIVVNYYAANKEAIKRGVKIERIFTLTRDVIFDPNSGKIKDRKAVEILEEQSRDGIDVTVVWKRHLPTPDLLEDFIIFDGSVVQAERSGTIEMYEGATITKVPSAIQHYERKFATLKSYGQPFDKDFNSDGAKGQASFG